MSVYDPREIVNHSCFKTIFRVFLILLEMQVKQAWTGQAAFAPHVCDIDTILAIGQESLCMELGLT